MKRFALTVACVLSVSAMLKADIYYPELPSHDHNTLNLVTDLLGEYQSNGTIDVGGSTYSAILYMRKSGLVTVDGNEHAHETFTATATVTDPDVGDVDTLQGTMTMDFGPPATSSTGVTTIDTTLTDMDFTGMLGTDTIEIKNDPSQTPPTGQTTVTGNPDGSFTSAASSTYLLK